MLTNITEPRGSYSTTRGELASTFLQSDLPIDQYVQTLTDPSNWKLYAGFNMLLLSPGPPYHGWFVSNSGGGGTITARQLREDEKRCGGITNGVESLDGMFWPKLIEGKQRMQEVLEKHPASSTEAELLEDLFEVLSWNCNEVVAARSDLRKTIRVTPLQIPSAQVATKSKYYGTRLSTFLLIKTTGEATFVERDVYKSSTEEEVSLGSTEDDRVFHFRITNVA